MHPDPRQIIESSIGQRISHIVTVTMLGIPGEPEQALSWLDVADNAGVDSDFIHALTAEMGVLDSLLVAGGAGLSRSVIETGSSDLQKLSIALGAGRLLCLVIRSQTGEIFALRSYVGVHPAIIFSIRNQIGRIARNANFAAVLTSGLMSGHHSTERAN